MSDRLIYFYFAVQHNKLETNTSFYGVRETTREIAVHVIIPVTLIVNERATTFVRIIITVSVNVIEMDLVTNVNVTKKALEAVLTFMIARVILKESDTVSVTVTDRGIVTKTVIVMETVRGLAIKKNIVTVKNEEKVMRLVIREDTNKKTGKCGRV